MVTMHIGMQSTSQETRKEMLFIAAGIVSLDKRSRPPIPESTIPSAHDA